MRKLVLVTLGLLAGAGVLAQAGEADSCKTFVDKNKACHDELYHKCNTALRAKMVQQVETAPPQFQSDMREGLDDKLEMFCTGFVTQVAGDDALEMCRSKLTTANAEEQAQWAKVQGCLNVASCEEYADCAVKFE